MCVSLDNIEQLPTVLIYKLNDVINAAGASAARFGIKVQHWIDDGTYLLLNVRQYVRIGFCVAM
jgi:hypothetical protein